ncbi:MAG: CDGSH iron-sulfur domain-containing protein [Bacteroidales bacterium]
MEKEKVRLEVIKGGPLRVQGNFRLVGKDLPDGTGETDIYLCRCGGSSRKPFCDGTHKRTGFAE